MSSSKSKKELWTNEVQDIFKYLLKQTTNGKLSRGAIKETAEIFRVSRNTFMRIRAKAATAGDHLGLVEVLQTKNLVKRDEKGYLLI